MKNSKFIGGSYFMKMMFLTILMIPALVHAQEVDPKKDIKTLYFLEGNWSIENFVLNDDKWESIGATKAEFNLELKGKFVNEKVEYLTKSGRLTMITIIGYDSRLQNFKLSNMGADYGNMDIYFGEWENEDLVFSNLESDIPDKLDDGRDLSFRLSYTDISDSSFTHIVEGTTDNGKTWFFFSKSIYSKI